MSDAAGWISGEWLSRAVRAQRSVALQPLTDGVIPL